MRRPNTKVMSLIGGGSLVYGSLLAGNGTEITWDATISTSSLFIRISAILAVICVLLGWRVVAGYLATVAATTVALYTIETARAGSLDGYALKFGTLLCGAILLLAASLARKKAA